MNSIFGRFSNNLFIHLCVTLGCLVWLLIIPSEGGKVTSISIQRAAMMLVLVMLLFISAGTWIWLRRNPRIDRVIINLI